MTEINTTLFENLKRDFQKICKRIIKTNLSKIESKLDEYESDIVNAHNALISYIRHYYKDLDNEGKIKYRDELKYIRNKIIVSIF